MNSIRATIFVLMLIVISGCSHYSDITGKVVDNSTGKPIEGAVVIAQWLTFRGWLGEQQRDLHKITETLTDKEGNFSLRGTTGFLLDPPEMLIYKDGYTPWRNDMNFPSRNIVKNHEWNNGVTYKLDVFTDRFTSVQLRDYIDSGIIGLGEVPMFHSIHNQVSDRATDELRAISDPKQNK